MARKLAMERFLLLLILWTVQSPNRSTTTLACTVEGASDFERKGSGPTSIIVCKDCFRATILNCATVYCIKDRACGSVFIGNAKYVECFSTNGKSNAACGSYDSSLGFGGPVCVRCIADGCDGGLVDTGYNEVNNGSCDQAPSQSPSAKPSKSAKPSAKPSQSPSAKPSKSAKPSSKPSAEPSAKPSSEPSAKPSVMPSRVPSSIPSFRPSPAPVVQTVEIKESLPWETILGYVFSGAVVVGFLACFLL